MTEPKRIRRYSPEGRRSAWEQVVLMSYDWLLQMSMERDATLLPGRRRDEITERAVARVLEREHITPDGRILWDPHPPKEDS